MGAQKTQENTVFHVKHSIFYLFFSQTHRASYCEKQELQKKQYIICVLRRQCTIARANDRIKCDQDGPRGEKCRRKQHTRSRVQKERRLVDTLILSANRRGLRIFGFVFCITQYESRRISTMKTTIAINANTTKLSVWKCRQTTR